jgi:hypothetical protein
LQQLQLLAMQWQSCCYFGKTHRVPLLGEVISIMDEEVTSIHMDEGPQGQVLGPVALLPHQLLASASHVEVLQS